MSTLDVHFVYPFLKISLKEQRVLFNFLYAWAWETERDFIFFIFIGRIHSTFCHIYWFVKISVFCLKDARVDDKEPWWPPGWMWRLPSFLFSSSFYPRSTFNKRHSHILSIPSLLSFLPFSIIFVFLSQSLSFLYVAVSAVPTATESP